MALSTNQLMFLAKRMEPGMDTDKKAAEACKLKVGTVYGWKATCPEYVEAYDRMGEDKYEFARQAGRDLLGLSYRARYRALASKDKRLAFRAAQDTDDRFGLPKSQDLEVSWSPGMEKLWQDAEKEGE